VSDRRAAWWEWALGIAVLVRVLLVYWRVFHPDPNAAYFPK
jgi:hypothetical protein